MAFARLPNEILRLVTLELDIKSLCRLSSSCKRLRIDAENVLYRRAVEQDRIDPKWPVSLTIAAISGRVHGFRRLLEETKWPIHEYSRSNLYKHPYTEKWAKSFKNHPYDWGLKKTTLLHIVSHIGNEEMVKLVLEKLGRENDEPYPSHPFMAYDLGGKTPLHRAAEMDHIGALKLLLAAGANINERDSDGERAALDYAVEHDNTAAAEFLVRAGADVLAYVHPFVPLAQACMNGNQYLANLLIEFGARENTDHALWCLTIGDDLSMAQLLIDAGAQPTVTDLERAAHWGGIEMLQLLMRNGGRFDYSTSNKTILHDGKCSPEITQLIIDEMPQAANTRDTSGLTPLDTIYHTDGDYFEEDTITSTAQCLIRAGGEVAGVERHFTEIKQMISRDMVGRSILHDACSSSSTKRLTLAKLLIDAGVDVKTRTDEGKTALHFAASACAFEMITFLVSAGVGVSHQDIFGNTALHQVAREAMVKHKKIQGYASLAGSTILGNADVTIEDVVGERRLEPLMRSGYIEVMRLLVAAGIDISLRNDKEETALDIIAKSRILGGGTPIPGFKRLEDIEAAGLSYSQMSESTQEWLFPEKDDGLDGTEVLEGFWDVVGGS